MKILRRVAGPGSAQTAREFAELGIAVAADGYFGFWFDEADPRWPALVEWRARQGRFAEPLSTTVFSKAELKTAQWLEFATDWQWGYPQPDEGDFGYLNVTYDDSGACGKCKVGLRQVAPFQFVGEPTWGRRSVLQLNWVFDELFVTPELWETVFRPVGVGAREVHNTKGKTLSTVVQLVVEDRVDLDMDGFEFHTCEVCGTKKYTVISRGFHPKPVTEPWGAMCRSNQWFGSGGRAFQGLIASRDVYEAIEAAKAKGARFIPCAS